ncbi:dienelactone hydrolase family protein [Gracilimonas mengyeensis]|uniref:Dienelactone hydrolase n=1 Tax=Gracilimonas mengyeensis TaxID=1302730 RepID=A0A521CHZ1_9BACT|nr:dienelactone hydrolase family protein [Gracilimonas mengyeensis]SMO59048.1 Dienelactone hydrolase [Gracilimonas mengyeensis]
MKRLLPLFAMLLFIVACGQGEYTENESNVVGQEISYSTDEITMNGYIAQDENNFEQRPGILVVHEWWGHDAHARQSAEKLAELGYVALAVDMYGNGKQASHPDDAMKFSNNVMSNFESAQARFTAAMETLKSQDNVDSTKIGAIGYCFGGSVILAMANVGVDLGGIAAFHAGLQLPVMPEDSLDTRILILNGAADPFVTEEHVATLTGAYEDLNADYQYISYENAMHAYTNPGADTLGQKFDLPLAYNAQADSLSWEEMKDFFDTTF